MAAFQAVNSSQPTLDQSLQTAQSTPTTPRPVRFVFPAQPAEDIQVDEDLVKTPTKEDFAPTSLAIAQAVDAVVATSQSDETSAPRLPLSRGSSHRSTKSLDSSLLSDIDMKRDHETDESENESMSGDDGPPSKKKKGQRFFCTDFSPCQLSFTRSEHLARHIRKHTGERPFQCHCGRRFSRLDNLRQHAQTVHVNEDIPGDSLAASGTRFQRQIRTERPRSSSNRSRTGPSGSISRGHGRNLSTSSITSISTVSSLGDDVRSRPTSMIESPARSRLSIETQNSGITSSPSIPQYFAVGSQSPSGFSTPTSATFSNSTGSPHFPSALQSPINTAHRAIAVAKPMHIRRMSVPSSHPYQSSPGHQYSSSYNMTPPSTLSGHSSMYASPVNTTFGHSRGLSLSAAEEQRRRTWHPSTREAQDNQRPTTSSGLSQYHVSNSPTLSVASSSAQPLPAMRLPGIESFDQAPPTLPSIKRGPSPMDLEPQTRPPPVMRAPGSYQRRHQHHVSWDPALHSGFNKLGITSHPSPPREVRWPGQTGPMVVTSGQGRTPNPGFQLQSAPALHEGPGPITSTNQPPPSNGERLRFDESEGSPRKSKRHAWYNGPLKPEMTVQIGLPMPALGHVRTSSEDSISSAGARTPSTGLVHEYHPAILHSNGYVQGGLMPMSPIHEQQPQKVFAAPTPIHPRASLLNHAVQAPQDTQQMQQAAYTLSSVQTQDRPRDWQQPQQPTTEPQVGSLPDMRRLEALVAVATGEGRS